MYMSNKIELIMFSGTVDRFLPMNIITSGAVTMEMDVGIFITF